MIIHLSETGLGKAEGKVETGADTTAWQGLGAMDRARAAFLAESCSLCRARMDEALR